MSISKRRNRTVRFLSVRMDRQMQADLRAIRACVRLVSPRDAIHEAALIRHILSEFRGTVEADRAARERQNGV